MAHLNELAAQALALEALKNHYSLGEGVTDTRTYAELKTKFVEQHLGQLVRTYQRNHHEPDTFDDTDLED